MLTFDGPAQTFQQARSIEERFVREAAEIDDPDLYMRQVGDAVAQRVARLVGDTPQRGLLAPLLRLDQAMSR